MEACLPGVGLGLGGGEGEVLRPGAGPQGCRRGQVMRRCGRSRAREACGMPLHGGRVWAAPPAVTDPRGVGAAGWLPSGQLPPASLWPGDGPCVALLMSVPVSVYASVLPVLLVATGTVY